MERKGKPPPGPYNVVVRFIGGTDMIVLEQVDEATAIDKFNEYTKGIGAQVGTTKRVSIMNGEWIETHWEYKHKDITGDTL